MTFDGHLKWGRNGAMTFDGHLRWGWNGAMTFDGHLKWGRNGAMTFDGHLKWGRNGAMTFDGHWKYLEEWSNDLWRPLKISGGMEQWPLTAIENVWRNGAMTFDDHWKCLEDWIRMRNSVICKGCNAPNLLRNLEKMSLTTRECGTLQTRYPLWPTIKIYPIITLQPTSRWHSLATIWGTRWEAMWVKRWEQSSMPSQLALQTTK
jgi:hypothetical protein